MLLAVIFSFASLRALANAVVAKQANNNVEVMTL
jgi:hypothetical protein